MRSLLIAELANSEGVSVPLVGWSLANALRQQVDAHIVTHIRNRDAFLRAGLTEGEDFTAIDSERVAKPIWRLRRLVRGDRGRNWTTAMAFGALAYYYFEHLLWKQFKDRIRSGEFDIVHRITPLSPAVPSLIARKCRQSGVPFVLGPINGGVPWPKGFDRERRQEREWLSYVRSAYKLLPGYRSTRRDSSIILVGSQNALAEMGRRWQSKCVLIPENGIDPERFSVVRTHKASRPLKAVFIGRLVPLKGVDMLLEAAAPLIRESAMTLTIIGKGPELPRLQSITQAEGIEAGVDFVGWVKHREVQHRLAAHDVLAFPSIREFGGGVVLEAMAVGLVPIVVNYGGLGELVTPQTGYPIPIGRRDEIVTRFREVLQTLSDNPGQIEDVSKAARERVLSRFTWASKAKEIAGIYQNMRGPIVTGTPYRNGVAAVGREPCMTGTTP